MKVLRLPVLLVSLLAACSGSDAQATTDAATNGATNSATTEKPCCDVCPPGEAVKPD